ncbi:MAG TPA: helix-turn-helix domain-containing protein, partial [Reyranellaceae bacterium]|nr:helix-turn-helix domain-containing protein [Reyranellaceae bacterium]
SDRLQSRHLAFTHDSLAHALAVRRPSVTLALQVLEGRGLVRAQRKAIEIVDPAALADIVKGFYARPALAAPA